MNLPLSGDSTNFTDFEALYKLGFGPPATVGISKGVIFGFGTSFSISLLVNRVLSVGPCSRFSATFKEISLLLLSPSTKILKYD